MAVKDELAARQKRAERFARFGMPEAAPAVPPELAPAPAPLESYTQLRPNALHVQSDSIQSMDTSAILRWQVSFLPFKIYVGPVLTPHLHSGLQHSFAKISSKA